MVYRLEITYDEIVDILDVRFIAGSTMGYTLPVGFCEVSDFNLMITSSLPNEVKVNNTIDDIRLNQLWPLIKQLGSLKNLFSKTISIFTESHSGVLDDIPGFAQLIPGSYKSNKPNNITGIDKIHFKGACFNGSFVNGTREPVLYSFALDQPPDDKTFEEPKKIF